MEQFFELPVNIGETERLFNGRLVTFAYSYKIYVTVDDQELAFERDDEQNFRVISESGDVKPVKREVVEAIIKALQELDN